jgi:GDP-4-dehydro-6-deoxy-D-mannose reductase
VVVDKHVLLTGACGFVGKVLLPILLKASYKVTCISSTKVAFDDSGASWVKLDINDGDEVDALVARTQPTHIIHLAAVSHVPTSFNDPERTWQTNVIGTLHLLKAVKAHCSNAFFLFVSSSEIYGETFKTGNPLSEDDLAQPMNPYAASKAAAELLVNQYFRQGMGGVIVRPFNHIGAGQSPAFVSASFAQQIAKIEAGKQPPILKVGNLEACRDFLDVKDVCHAYLALLDLSVTTLTDRVFNIASGKPVRIAQILEVLLEQSAATIAVEEDAERMRPSDIPVAAGDCSRIHALTGWQPRYDLSETLAELLNYWRSQV